MAENDRITVLLPPELAKLVRESVDGDRYVVEGDVVIDALNDWRIKQAVRAEKLAQLRQLISDGLMSGSESVTAEEFSAIKREGRERLAGKTRQ